MKKHWFHGFSEDWDASLRLVCFHHAGGSASSFNGWKKHLPQEIGLIKTQLPGRELHNNHHPYNHINPIIQELMEHSRLLLDKPIAFYGHSLGAIVAFELARSLRRSGKREPVCLFVSGRRAPQCSLSHPPLFKLPESELLKYMSLMGGVVGNVLNHKKWLDHLVPIIRADLEVSDDYHYYPEAPLDLPIYAFGGTEDRIVSQAEWKAWQAQTKAEFMGESIKGKHFFPPKSQIILVQMISQRLLNFFHQTPSQQLLEWSQLLLVHQDYACNCVLLQ